MKVSKKGGEIVMLKSKIVNFIAVGTLFFGALAPSALADVRVSGNGAFSRTNASLSENNNASINQHNNAQFENNVSVKGDTGGNRSDFNTGGDGGIVTGGTSANVEILNKAGQNSLNLSNLNCGCNRLGDVIVSGNGAKSHTNVDERANNSLNVDQSNDTTVNNHVNVRGKTGHNSSDFNTGGSSFVSTGDTNAEVMLHNIAGSNRLGL